MTQRNAQHTPGPWTLKKLNCPNPYWQQFSIHAGSVLVGNLDLVTNHSNTTATARIIEVAPLLVEALDSILGCSTNDGGQAGEHELRQRILQISLTARAAIAKATAQD